MKIRSYSDLVATLRNRMRDGGEERWSSAEMRQALMNGVQEWAGRVNVEQEYSVTWSSDSYTVALPEYVIEPLTPYVQPPLSDWQQQALPAQADRQWAPFINWRVEPDGSGGRVLRVPHLYDAPGKILYWIENGAMPADGTLDGAITAAATTITLASVDDLPMNGYALIGDEIIGYAGVDAAAVQLLNVQRGLLASAAASHSNGATVAWAVAAPVTILFNQLFDAAMAELHGLYLTDASPQERAHHERLTMYHRTLADQFWRRWTPMRRPRLMIGEF